MLRATVDLSWRRLVKPLLVLALLVVAVERFCCAGLTLDEQTHLVGLKAILSFAGDALRGAAPDFTALPGDLEFYGIGIFLPAYGLTQLDGWLSDSVELLRWSRALHLLALLCYLASLFAVHRILRRQGAAPALYGTLALALLPVFLGHGLFNYKDMPIATGVIYCLLFTLRFCDQPRRRNLYGFWLVVVWLGTQKIAALLLIGPFPLAILYRLAQQRRRDLWLAGGLGGLGALLLLFAATPPAWVEPLHFLASNLDYMSKHGWRGCMVTDGRCVAVQSADWSPLAYLWHWTLAKVPLPYLLCFAVAALALLRRPSLSGGLALATMLVFLAGVAYRGSTLYDGLRHVLFLLPLGICVIFSNAVLVHRAARIAAALMLAWLAVENLKFYPYNYAWFTPTTSLAAQHGRYDTDYWGYSLRAALAGVPPGASVRGMGTQQALALLGPAPAGSTPPSYWAHVNRGGLKLPSGCEQLGSVARHTLLGHKITMSLVARCR